MSTLYRQIQIDTLDPDVRYYIKRKAALDDKLCKMYDKIEDTKSLLITARAKKTAIEAEKLTADNICKVLICFDKLYAVMDEYEQRKFMESLVSEVHVYEERKPNGQWLKSIKFELSIIEEDMEICLDNETHVENIVGLTDYSGLGLFDGVLICHYTDSRKYDFEQLSQYSEFKAYALTDEDSIVYEEE